MKHPSFCAAVTLIALIASPALSEAKNKKVAAEGERWLGDLQKNISSDLAEGKPLIIQVHVPLCDNNIIRCGSRGLGDGDNLKRNLYWATSGGFVGWFGRRGSKWKEVHRVANPEDDVLEARVWQRTFTTPTVFDRDAVGKRFEVYVVAYAWRGSAIRAAMDAYTLDLFGGDPRVVELDDGTELRAGGEAQVVSFVGHNGWMDFPDYDWKKVASKSRKKSARAKGTIAVACITEDYLAGEVSAPERVPLLMTRWLLFAGAHSFEGAVSALASGQTLGGIRTAAVRNYAKGQGKKARRVSGAFTNPADKRWKNL